MHFLTQYPASNSLHNKERHKGHKVEDLRCRLNGQQMPSACCCFITVKDVKFKLFRYVRLKSGDGDSCFCKV